MSKKREGGIWVIVCDWEDKDGTPCNLGFEGDRAMFVDPDAGMSDVNHFQCGKHHGVIKQSEKEEYQLPDGHKLDESTITPKGLHTAGEIGVELDGFKPDLGGKVWDGITEVNIKEKPNG